MDKKSSAALRRGNGESRPAQARRASQDWLVGGGEMAKVIKAKDWSLTRLGAIDSWPQSLRTIVSLAQASSSPISLVWGAGHTQIYNDGYWPICGSKHPISMGQDFRECWSSAFPVVGEAYASAWSGKSAYLESMRMFLDRYGFLEETWFTFSFSPVTDESGGVGGLFHLVTEMTSQLLSERRTKTLRELANCTGKARTSQEAIGLTMQALLEAELDLPFALLCLVEGEGASLVGQTGLSAAIAQAAVNPGAGGDPSWSIGEVARTGQARQLDLGDRLAGLKVGPYAEPPTTAVVLPIFKAGSDLPAAVLVLGASSRLPMNGTYRAFCDLVAAAVAMNLDSARAYEEAQAKADALAQLDRLKIDFFSNISHEFRTPLTLILGTTEAALALPKATPAGESLETIQRNALRLFKLVNTLLDFSRIEAGRARVTLQPTDLGALTADLASSFRSLVEKAGLTFTVDCPPLAEPVSIDREMYEKIVLNLISNAFKFTFEGGIRIALDSHQGRARLSVADTGVGIPEAEVPHLFERFHRVQGTKGRSYEGSGSGSGIGLALVQDLARLHGGVASASSRLGAGSRFEVSFPLGTSPLPPERGEADIATGLTGPIAAPFLAEASSWLVDDALALAETAGAAPPADARPRESGRILLVEDNADMRRYVGRLLRERGWEVEAFGDGEAALRSARARLPDLVVSDVMLPGLDGFDLLKALKDGESTRALPVILVSARAGEEAGIAALQKGADDYLTKPFSGRDLQSRVAARVEIARARAEAVRARERLHEQFMQAPVAVCILGGPDLVFELANPLYLKMAARKDILGKSLVAVFPEVGPDGPAIQVFQKVYATGEPFTAEEFRVPLLRNGSAEDAYFKFTAQPVRDPAGKVTDVIVVLVEVTAQVLARRRIESLLEELKVADRRKDEFLATLAHELRNPMAAISMALSLLERAPGDAARSARYQQTARRQMQSLVRLVDDLLDVSRITRGIVHLRKEDVDLGAIVQTAVTATRPVLEARGHQLSVTVASGSFRLEADPMRLEQVLVNLLTNAAKYTEPNGAISVRLAREEIDGAPQAVLRVSDNGRGIPHDMLEKVFDLFIQVAPEMDRKTGGLGLGLTLVKRLVEMHGGTASARSEGEGKGSEFVVRLPLATNSPLPAQALEVQALSTSPDSWKRRIVLVEDSEDVRETVKLFLESLGHEVTAAVDGLEGLATILKVRPDLALVDLGLAGIDGFELARRARAAPGGDQLYLVSLSGYGGPEAKAKAEGAGFNLHLTKPVDSDLLSLVVSDAKAPIRRDRAGAALERS